MHMLIHSLYVFQHSYTYAYIIMLQILNVYFSSMFTASSSDFAKWKFYSFYIRHKFGRSIGLEMSMMHNIELWQVVAEMSMITNVNLWQGY